MSNNVTFEQVERLANELTFPEKLKLVARLSEQLSASMSLALPLDQEQAQREAMAEALLSELDAIADSIGGEFDSAEDLRQIREERANC